MGDNQSTDEEGHFANYADPYYYYVSLELV